MSVYILTQRYFCREYDQTKQIFANAFPWLFPGGIGDIYDVQTGKKPLKEWGKHLLRYFDGRFLKDQLFCLYAFNTIQRHTNNTQGSYFFTGDRFLGKQPPTIEELKQQIQEKNFSYCNKLRYFAQGIKGSDNWWRSRTQDLEAWINHHVSRGNGPPTFFITFSCAEYWWPDLRRILAELEEQGGHKSAADAIRQGDMKAIRKATRKYTLFVNDFFMKRARTFMDTVVKNALGIKYYWGRVEFAPGRGQIHLHLLGIADDRAYLDDFYKAKTMQAKAAVVDKYARERLDMTADVDIEDKDRKRRPDGLTSVLRRRYCESTDEVEDVRLLAQDCMCHHCNKYCLRDVKANQPRQCRMHYGTESECGNEKTPGLPQHDTSYIHTDDKGVRHFRMKRQHSVRVVQHSRTLLKGWRANCDIKLLLYFTNPQRPDINEIDEVCRYVVAYTAKKNHTSRFEKTIVQDLIQG